MRKSTLLISAALTLASSATFGAPQFTLSKDHRITTVVPDGAAFTLHQGTRNGASGSGSIYVYNNFATKYPNGLYFCCSGWTVSGPSSITGCFCEVGTPFTTRKSTSITTIALGLGYVSGTDSATVSLYADDNGLPGSVIASAPVNNIPVSGSCCQTVQVTIPTTLLDGHTQYWIVVSASGDTFLSWNYQTVDTAYNGTYAYNANNSGWGAYSLPLVGAMQVN